MNPTHNTKVQTDVYSPSKWNAQDIEEHKASIISKGNKAIYDDTEVYYDNKAQLDAAHPPAPEDDGTGSGMAPLTLVCCQNIGLIYIKFPDGEWVNIPFARVPNT